MSRNLYLKSTHLFLVTVHLASEGEMPLRFPFDVQHEILIFTNKVYTFKGLIICLA